MTEEQVFLAVLELADPAERLAYLDEVCGRDTDLRRHVEELLAAHFKSGAFLDEPAAAQMAPGLGSPNNDNTVALPINRGLKDVAVERKTDEEPNDLHFLQPSSRAGSLGRIGHYEVLEILGKGGFGIVLRALDELLQRVVALKVLAPAIAATSPARKRFLREARSSAQIRHENVVQVYAVEEQPLPYLVMEFVPGETLQQRLDRSGPLETPEIVRLGLQIAEGLAAAHATGLIHRDIKPANILIEKGTHERVKITDFGLARAADDASLTQSGVVAGTPMYMAPEQASGDTLDHRADLFSLGSVLYVMASGRPPFRASTTFAVLKRVVEEEPRPIQDVIPEVPPWLCKLIARLHAKKREERFATAREVADLLGRCQTEMAHLGNVMDLVDKPAPLRDPLLPRESRKGELAAVQKQPPAQDVPAAATAVGRPPSHPGRWVAAAVLLLLLGGLCFFEATGVTDFRSTIRSLFSSETSLRVEQQTPPDAKVADAGSKGSDPKTVPNGKIDPKVDAKLKVAVAPPVPSIHDSWIEAIRLLPLEQQRAAVTGRMKQHLHGFEEALLKAIPAMSADTQAMVVNVCLKERQPAFAGLEDAWLKVIPVLAVETQVVLQTAWLKERNHAFDGSITHQAEGNVIATLEVPAPAAQDLLPLRALTGLKTLICRSTVGWDNRAESDAVVLLSLKSLEKINGKPVAQFWKDVDAKKQNSRNGSSWSPR
jgi:serine/threonine protein kinase